MHHRSGIGHSFTRADCINPGNFCRLLAIHRRQRSQGKTISFPVMCSQQKALGNRLEHRNSLLLTRSPGNVAERNDIPDGFWQQNITAQSIVSWRGYAFENVCFNHIPQIKRALGISGISSTQSAWTKTSGDDCGTQIDLIISRRDNIVNMCEIKFYSGEFAVDRKYDIVLRNRQSLLEEKLPKRSSIHKTLITTYGLKDNEYRWSFDNVISMDALFDQT